MKNIFLALVVSCFTIGMTAQRERSIDLDEWYVSLGVNAINSLGTKSPFSDPGDWAFKFPITAAIETRWSELFAVEVALSLNGFDANSPIDAVGPSDEDIPYISVDSALKYYFGHHILPRAEWIDFYANAGFGLFILDDANLSFNFGGGVLFWLNRDHTFGLRAQGIGKFAFNHSDTGVVYPNNHFQYSLQAVIKL
jgi:hypothetical protein